MAARPRASEARDTRRDLIEAALELFAEKGYFGTSLRDIATAVGIRESAIYHHFADKAALFEAVLFDAHCDGTRMGPTPPPPFEGPAVALPGFLERYVAAMLDRFATLRERRRFRIMMSDGARLAVENKVNYFDKMAVARQPLVDLMAALISDGLVRPRDPEQTAMLLMAPIIAWRQMLMVAPDSPMVQNRRQFAKLAVESFLFGVAVEPPRGAVHLNDRSTERADG